MGASVEIRLELEGVADARPVLEDLPDGELAREIAEERLGAAVPFLDDDARRWAVAVIIDGLRLFAIGSGGTWTIARPSDVDEADATFAATRVHRALGGRTADWDSDR